MLVQTIVFVMTCTPMKCIAHYIHVHSFTLYMRSRSEQKWSNKHISLNNILH